MSCATPLDTLSSVFMRTSAGQRRSTALMREELVQTKGRDMMYMQRERERLEAEERERLRNLRHQQTQAQRQQRMLMAAAVAGGAITLCLIIATVMMIR